MREGNIYSLSTLAGLGGVPHPRSGKKGGTESQVQMGRGVPHPSDGGRGAQYALKTGGTPSQVWMGVPHYMSRWGVPIPGPDRGYPILLMGGTPIQDHDGVPKSKTGWGTPRPRLDGVLLPIKHWIGYPPVNKASTCYVVGGVPLVFTQADFRVSNCFHRFQLYCNELCLRLCQINTKMYL